MDRLDLLAVAGAMGIDRDEIETRQRFLELRMGGSSPLDDVRERLQAALPKILDAFYEHLASYEETRALLADPEQVERLKKSQRAYFDRLIAGPFDWNYVQDRLRVGLVHEKVGLPQRWYVGSYARILRDLLAPVWDLCGDDRQRFLDVFGLLIKRAFFDIGLALDTNAHTDRQASDQRYLDLVHGINGIVWEADMKDGIPHFTFVSRQADAILGYPPEQWLADGAFWFDHIHPDDCDSILRETQDLVDREADGTREFRMIAADGRVVWLHNACRISRDASEDVVQRRRGVMVDITARKQNEEALRLKTGQLETITEAMSTYLLEGDWGAASDRLLRGALQETQSEYGFAGAVVDGPVLRVLAHSGIVWDSHVNRDFYDNALRTYEEVGYLEFRDLDNLFGRVITSGRSLIANRPASDPHSGGLPPGHPPLRCFLGVPILREGEVVGLIGVANRPGGYSKAEEAHLELLAKPAGILYDSYRRRMREEVLEAQLFEKQKMEAIGRLAGGVAHDFNNLLVGILAHADLLKLRSRPGDDTHETATIIANAAERAGQLTRQLLGFARRGKNQQTAVDLHAIIDEVVGLLERTVDRRVRIQRTFGSDGATVLGDPGQIQQVILNLAVNARDAMTGEGQLSFGTEAVEHDPGDDVSFPGMTPGSYVHMWVRDTGPGIPEELRDQIFEPFFTTKEDGSGTGMGLAMAYGIVKNHHGSIRVESEVGQGTTFHILLPLIAAPPEPEKTGQKEELPRGHARILVVDDEKGVRDVVSAVLGVLGYQVVTASGGQQAVDHYRQFGHQIDLVILDVIMPGMGGVDCFRALKSLDPDLKFIVSTGCGRDAAVRAILDGGASGLVQKPYRSSELAEAVARALAGDRS